MPVRSHTQVTLAWAGDMAFNVTAGAHEFVLDGNATRGPSPVQLLAVSLAGCMASDVALILTRARQPLHALTVTLDAERAQTDPRRFVRVVIRFAVEGAVAPAQLERAIALSREKYCSVWHTLRQDLPLEISTSINSGE